MYSEELLELNQEKNRVLMKMNFLLEGLQDVNDKEEKNATLELINKLKIRLDRINEQVKSISMSKEDTKQAYEEVQNQDIGEQVVYNTETTSEESYTDEPETQETETQETETQESYEDEDAKEEYQEDSDDQGNSENQGSDESQESDEEDDESPRVYVGRKDNGNILAYYQRVKKQGK